MSYNLTGLDWNATNLLVVAQVVHTQLDGITGTLILLVVFLGCLAAFRSREFLDNWNTASFITTIIGALFWFIGLLPWVHAVVPTSLLIIGLLVKAFTSN